MVMEDVPGWWGVSLFLEMAYNPPIFLSFGLLSLAHLLFLFHLGRFLVRCIPLGRGFIRSYWVSLDNPFWHNFRIIFPYFSSLPILGKTPSQGKTPKIMLLRLPLLGEWFPLPNAHLAHILGLFRMHPNPYRSLKTPAEGLSPSFRAFSPVCKLYWGFWVPFTPY